LPLVCCKINFDCGEQSIAWPKPNWIRKKTSNTHGISGYIQMNPKAHFTSRACHQIINFLT